MICPCGSTLDYQKCCEPLISGSRNASAPLELMRSRYSAYTQCEVEYILKTTDPKTRKQYTAKSIKAWAESVRWLKLEIIEAVDNIVEFKAYFEESGKIEIHHERSIFRQVEGVWYFVSGS